MINILGLHLLTHKDYNEIMTTFKTYADSINGKLSEDRKNYSRSIAEIRQVVKTAESKMTDTNNRARAFMEFAMERMPLKRYRKDAKKYFPEIITDATCICNLSTHEESANITASGVSVKDCYIRRDVGAYKE